MTAKTQHGIKDIALGRSDLFRVGPRKLEVRPGWNARETDFDPADEVDLALARSIADGGVREPISVIWDAGHLYVTNGHRRRAATIYAIETLGAEIKSVPVQTEPRFASEAEHVLSQIVRNDGKPLSPTEKGAVFKRLLDFGWSASEIATKTGLSQTRITQCLELHAAPEPVKALVRDGSVSATFAMQALRTHDGDAGKAEAELRGALDTARATGKSRATPKHVDAAGSGAKASLKAVLREAFDASSVDQTENGPVVISMPAEQFLRVRQALGLSRLSGDPS